MLHPAVDIRRWLDRFTLAAHRERVIAHVLNIARQSPGSAPPDLDAGNVERYFPHAFDRAPSDIFSPRDLAVTEHFRELAGGAAALGRATPTDLLLPALGRAPRRELSKVGGLPYRPAALPWPTSSDGRPMMFLAQLNFVDSREALAAQGIDALPGDVLLIFTPGEWPIDFVEGAGEEGDGSALVFEWRPLGLTDLVCPDAVPRCERPLEPVFFELHRTTDHPVPPPEIERDEARVRAVYWSSKIGGVPFWEQEPVREAGRFLAALHSMNPWDEEFPFPNVPSMPLAELRSLNLPMFGDVGTLNLFLTEDGRVRWTIQCG